MELYEIYRDDLRKHKNDYWKAIKALDYIPRDDKFVRNAFNFGHGTIADMNEYMHNNRIYCIWIDAHTMQLVTSVPV